MEAVRGSSRLSMPTPGESGGCELSVSEGVGKQISGARVGGAEYYSFAAFLVVLIRGGTEPPPTAPPNPPSPSPSPSTLCPPTPYQLLHAHLPHPTYQPPTPPAPLKASR